MKMLGANRAVKVTALDELPGKINYFIGNDPAKWRTNIPTYAQVRYAGIYRGIDLVYDGNPSADGQLEFDFTVAPHADPGRIRLRFAGPNELHLAANGDLVVTTANGELAFHKPVAYQILNGGRKPIAGDFVLMGKHTVGFRLGSYDHAKALVIDPELAFSTFLGGSGFYGDTGNAIAVDAAGNVYVAGAANSTDFPVTPGAYQTANHAASDEARNAFVTKLNPTGTELVYSTYLGGSGSAGGGDVANAIAVDAAGNAYVAGMAYSADFPVTPGAFQTTNRAAANEDPNAFVTKLNETGTALVYSTYLGGSGLAAETQVSGDYGNAIALDAAGNAYVAGQAYSVDFPVTPAAFQTANRAAANKFSNAFVSKLNPSGTALVYSTYLGGSTHPGGYVNDIGYAIAADAAGDAYVAGQTFSSDFPTTTGAYQTTNCAFAIKGPNAFITKFNPTGTALVYSTYLGGSGFPIAVGIGGGDGASSIALDATGDAYVAGAAASTDFPVTPGAFQTTNHGAAHNFTNAFITKLNPAGSALVYSTYLGGSGGIINRTPSLFGLAADEASGVAIDSSGNAYVTGSTASSDFPVTAGAYQTTNNDSFAQCAGSCIGGNNAFITELNSTGSALVYSTYLGGNGINPLVFPGVAVWGKGDQASGLALDNSGNVYVTGSAVSYDFPVTAGAFQETVKSRSGNALIAKLNMSATSTATTPTVTVMPASSVITSAQPLTVTVSVSGRSGNPEPTGTIWLASYNNYSSAAATLSGGSATIDIPAGSLLVGPPGTAPVADVLIAKYIPDAASSSTYNFSSGLSSVTVAQAGTSGFVVAGTAVTVNPGATAGNTSAITVTPFGGFTGSVTLTATLIAGPSGAQNLPTLSFGSTSPVSITGTAAATATLTISTTAPTSCGQSYPAPRGLPWYTGLGGALACLCLLGIRARRRRWRTAFAVLSLLLALAGGFLACGGSSPCTPTPGTTPGTYTITVTGSSGATSATGTVTLTVQ